MGERDPWRDRTFVRPDAHRVRLIQVNIEVSPQRKNEGASAFARFDLMEMLK